MATTARSGTAPSLFARLFVFVVIFLDAVLAHLTAPDSDIQTSSTFAEATWAIIYGVAVVGLLRSRARALDLVRRHWFLAALLLLAVVSTLWSEDAALTLRRSVGLIGTTLCAYFIVTHFTLEQFLDTFGDVVIVAAVASFLVVIVTPDIGIMQTEYPGAWRGLFGHKNLLGLFLVPGILTLLARNAIGARWRSPARWLGLALCVFELILSRSLTSVLTLSICILAVAAVVSWQRNPGSRWWIGTTVAAVALGFAALSLSGANLSEILPLLGRDASLTGRVDFWPQLTQAITQRPFLGYGYDVFWKPGGAYTRFVTGIGWRPPHAHEGFLDVGLDLGALGLALVGILLGRGIGAAYQRAKSARLGDSWPLAVLVFIVISNLTETTLTRYNNFNWILFVVALLYARTATAGERPRVPDAAPRPHLLHAPGPLEPRLTRTPS
jgi:O-antigen ligase